MRPLEKLPRIAKLLDSAKADDVRAAIGEVEASGEATPAAIHFAKGALALREGDLASASRDLGEASKELEASGEREASELARVEALLAELRANPREAARVRDAYVALASSTASKRVKVAALRGAGTAHRIVGDAVLAQKCFLEAVALSTDLLDERAMVLNSLGTLYVLLGAHGAAQALLEHAAELHHQLGNVVGEAIAHGQLGAAFLALGDRERARKHLQLQEWHAGRIGDNFGRARALVYLADIALELGRTEDAHEIATRALAVAEEAKLSTWIAYAKRSRGRAAFGEDGRRDLEDARERFEALGLRLGLALTSWDLAATRGGSEDFHPEGEKVFAPAWEIASLALAPRVAEIVQAASGAHELAVAALAQSAPHFLMMHEIDLVYRAPEELTKIASRRIAAQRNHGRLGALALLPPGLVVAAIVAPHAGSSHAIGHPDESARAAVLFESAGSIAWAWPTNAASSIASDLARVLPSLGAGARAAIDLFPSARVVAPPFLGGVGAVTEGLSIGPLLARAEALAPHAIEIAASIDVGEAGEATLAQTGFATSRSAAARVV